MKKQERRHQLIVESLQDRALVTTAELATTVGVSEVTLRRDLKHLELTGVVLRQHGGAQLVNGRPEAESRFAERELLNATAKAAIGERAADLVDSGEHLAMNDGSTVMRVATALREHSAAVSVTTNALNIALNLSDSSTTDVWVLGGQVRRASYGTFNSDPNMFGGRRFDTTIIGVESLDSTSVALDHPYDLAVARAMIERSERVVVVADSSKWRRRGREELCGWDEVDVLVTDAPATGPIRELSDFGVSVQLVNPE